MKASFRAISLVVAGFFLCFCCLSSARSQTQSQQSTQKEAPVTHHASGSFDVKATPADGQSGDTISRMTLDKQFHGDLEGTSQGQMLATGSAKGSGAYVAIERITGTLQGHAGSFTLQHSGTMNRGAPQLTITVVPDSGTEQLAGIEGKMNIIIAADGKHSYDFEYTLPSPNEGAMK
jgi:hypothetical protein